MKEKDSTRLGGFCSPPSSEMTKPRAMQPWMPMGSPTGSKRTSCDYAPVSYDSMLEPIQNLLLGNRHNPNRAYPNAVGTQAPVPYLGQPFPCVPSFDVYGNPIFPVCPPVQAAVQQNNTGMSMEQVFQMFRNVSQTNPNLLNEGCQWMLPQMERGRCSTHLASEETSSPHWEQFHITPRSPFDSDFLSDWEARQYNQLTQADRMLLPSGMNNPYLQDDGRPCLLAQKEVDGYSNYVYPDSETLLPPTYLEQQPTVPLRPRSRRELRRDIRGLGEQTKQEVSDWINSEEYKQRLDNSYAFAVNRVPNFITRYPDKTHWIEDVIGGQLEGVGKVTGRPQTRLFDRLHPDVKGHTGSLTDNIYVRRGLSDFDSHNAMEHETFHSSDPFGRLNEINEYWTECVQKEHFDKRRSDFENRQDWRTYRRDKKYYENPVEMRVRAYKVLKYMRDHGIKNGKDFLALSYSDLKDADTDVQQYHMFYNSEAGADYLDHFI